MTIHAIRQQLHDFIDKADERKVKAMFVMLENEINPANAELVSRELELENGIVAGVPWVEVRQKVKEILDKVNH